MADSNVRNMEEAQNLRSSDRIRAFLRAQIIFNNRMSTIDCIVKNISPTGARIALNDALTVPTEFELYIPQRGRSHHARLVWRDKDAIGVDFIDVPPTAAPPSGELPATGTEARLRELEAQNAELKARIRTLCKRLEDLGQDPNLRD
ncbi:MAG: PilZ domain-containing protein [Methylovirgula sp.]